MYSIGQFVVNQGYSFKLPRGELPFLIPPEVPFELSVDRGACRTADRIDHCVPIFKERVELVSGMPAGTMIPEKPPKQIRDWSVWTGWRNIGDGRVCVRRKASRHVTPDVEGYDLRTTWLFNAKDQWYQLEAQTKWQELETAEADLPFQAEILVTHFERSEAASHSPVVEAAAPEEAEPARRAVREADGEAAAEEDARPERPSDEAAEAEDEEEWVEELAPNHFLTHLPKCKKCNICLQAKLTSRPHRRRNNQAESLREARDIEEPGGPVERISVDHLFAYDSPGEGDEVVSLVCRDRYSGVVWTYPAETRESEEVEDGLRHFCGRKAPIVSVASDRAPEILKAIRDCGFNSEPAVANDMCNVTMEPPKVIMDLAKEKGLEMAPTRYEAHVQYPYEEYLIPFGALVWYRNKDAGTFAPKGEPALYMGPEVVDGIRHKGAHMVAALRSIRDGDFAVTVTKDLAVPNGRWSFPLAKARVLDEVNPHHRLPPAVGLVPTITPLLAERGLTACWTFTSPCAWSETTSRRRRRKCLPSQAQVTSQRRSPQVGRLLVLT